MKLYMKVFVSTDQIIEILNGNGFMKIDVPSDANYQWVYNRNVKKSGVEFVWEIDDV